MISHDDYFHCSSILSLLTVLSSLYSLSHYILSLRLQSFCLRSDHIFNWCTSQPEIRLLIFAWCSALHREVVTNLTSTLICCHEFTTHHFLMMDGWLVGETRGLQRESLMWQGSTIWLYFNTLRSITFRPYTHNISLPFCTLLKLFSCFPVQMKLNSFSATAYRLLFTALCFRKKERKKIGLELRYGYHLTTKPPVQFLP